MLAKDFMDEKGLMSNLALSVAHEKDTKGILLGRLSDGSVVSFDCDEKKHRLNRHVVVFDDAEESHKNDNDFKVPYLRQMIKREESVLVSDTDAQLFSELAGEFEDAGYDVKAIDFIADDSIYEKLTSENEELDNRLFGWNIMRELEPRFPGEDVQNRAFLLANAILCRTRSSEFEESIKDTKTALLTALLMRVYLDAKMENSIDAVYKVATNPRGKDILDELFDESKLNGELALCLGPYKLFKSLGSGVEGNVLEDIGMSLLPFHAAKSKLSVEKEKSIDFVNLGKEKCAYFLIGKYNHLNDDIVPSTILTCATYDLFRYADTRVLTHRCDVPVSFMLNKLSGYIKYIASSINVFRPRNISIVYTLPDFASLEKIYPTEWPAILSASAIKIGLSVTDKDTAEKLLFYQGKGKVESIVKMPSTHLCVVLPGCDVLCCYRLS